MNVRYRNRQGDPINMVEWSLLFSHPTYLRVQLSTITKDGVELASVSTIWLGLDHNMGGDVPLIFETRVFGDSRVDGWMHRYSTEAEAREGHDAMIERVKIELEPAEAGEGPTP